MANKIVETTRKLAEDAVAKFGLELVDVEFVVENKYRYLRVFIYKKEGVTMEDCTNVHKDINLYIDDAIEYDEQYFLEVSSPGYERPLKNEADFNRYMGEQVNVKLYAHVNGVKSYEGKLEQYKDGVIIVDVQGEKMEFEVKKTSKIKRLFESK